MPVIGGLVLLGSVLLGVSPSAAAPVLPEIRMTVENRVPACVTPERLMAFLETRNRSLSPRFRGIASQYRYHGEAWRVRWDYAFFQMAIETNFLTYRRPDGRMGDVDPRQNNFAGIGTTGGGVPGDRFPDVSTGVLGQIQHLVAYSGEFVVQPVAPRTKLKQEHILLKSRELNRPVRFSDLARRWAADPKYASAIEWVAQSYRDQYCRGAGSAQPVQVPRPQTPMQAPPPVEVLPWLNRPVQPRADGARMLTTGSVDTASNKRPEPPSVRTVWTREGEKKAKQRKLDEVLGQTVLSASEGQDPPPPVPVTPRAAVPEPAGAEDKSAAPEEPIHFALFTPPAWLAEGGGAANPGEAAKPDAFAQPAGLGMKQEACSIETATYGGDKAVLVRVTEGQRARYVALSVLPGFEKSMTESFLASRTQGGGVAIGEFASRDAAIARANELCALR